MKNKKNLTAFVVMVLIGVLLSGCGYVNDEETEVAKQSGQVTEGIQV